MLKNGGKKSALSFLLIWDQETKISYSDCEMKGRDLTGYGREQKERSLTENRKC